MIQVKALKTFVLPTSMGMIVANAGETVSVPESVIDGLVQAGSIDQPEAPEAEFEDAGDSMTSDAPAASGVALDKQAQAPAPAAPKPPRGKPGPKPKTPKAPRKLAAKTAATASVPAAAPDPMDAPVA